MRSVFAVLLAMCLVLGLAGCHKEAAPTTAPATAPATPTVPTSVTEPTVAPEVKTVVDVFLPGESFTNYETLLSGALSEKELACRAHYAEDDAQTQAAQLQEQVKKGAKCIVLVPVDSMTLSEELHQAKQAGIPVITLDRQLLYAESVRCAVSFDYVSVGVMLGSRIAETYNLTTAKEEKRSYTIEFLMGAAEDENALLIHKGIISVLQPFLDSGVLTTLTGRVTMEDTFVFGWDTGLAKEKCLQYLEKYADKPMDILCCASDSIAAGGIQALAERGYVGENWPMITGVGGQQSGLEMIAAGQQSMTIYKDLAAAMELCSRMAADLLAGKSLPAADNAVVSFGNQNAPLYIAPVAPVLSPADLLQYGFQNLELPEQTVPETTAPDGEYGVELA